MLNPGQLVANVLIVAVKKDGTVLGSTSVLLQPGERISKLLGTEPPDGLIPEAAGQGDGYVFVSSDLPVYLTSLFGDDAVNVLSNIPPQQSPEGFDPAAGIPKIEINPSLGVVQPGGDKPFQVEGGTGTPTWSVNGTPGGDSTVGTIDNQGIYTAPAQVPEESPTVTISATVDNQTAGASLDILDKEALFTSVSIVQSVVYLGSLQNLYTAELSILSGSGSGSQPAAVDPAQGSTDSEIFTVPSGFAKQTLAQFPNEEISKMISFTASDDNEYLLLAAKTSGKVIRLDPRIVPGGNPTDVATDLNQPTALVFDSVSGSLLVAEQDKITTVPQVQLEIGLSSQAQAFPAPPLPQRAELLPIQGTSGMVVNDCTGDVIISNGETGEILRYVPTTGSLTTVFSGVQGPAQMLAIHREGVSCPQSFHLLIIEQETDQVLLAVPGRGFRTGWISARQSTDLAFLPGVTPFASSAAILLPEAVAGGTQQLGGFELSAVPIPRIYRARPVNPPREQPQIELGDAVDFTLSSDLQFATSCQDGTTAQGNVLIELQAQGTLGTQNNLPFISGTFTGVFQDSSQGTEGVFSDTCMLQGSLGIAVTPSETGPITNLSGSWQVVIEGVANCVTEEEGFTEQGEDFFDLAFGGEIIQEGEGLSGSLLLPLGEVFDDTDDDPITCSQPGQCEFEEEESGICSLTCSPATPNCEFQLDLSGTIE